MRITTRVVRDYLHTVVAGPRYAETGDAALLRSFVSCGDGEAFAELLRRHGPMVLGLARRVAGDAQAAEDVYQATFLVLSRKAHSLRRPDALAAWLHGVAFRLALRARKGNSHRREQEARASVAQSTIDPLDELSARELLAILDQELNRLPDCHRLPLVLCGLQGLSQDEAARRLGWSAGSLKGRLERGRQRLRLRLQHRGLILPAALAGTLLLGQAAPAVPPSLVEATRHAALSGTASTTVLGLANHAARMALLARLKSIAVVVALVGGLGVGLVYWPGAPAAPSEPPVEPATMADGEQLPDQPGDRRGDPLPDGALSRFGTLERRAVGARLALSADSKLIIGVRGNIYVHVWDAATGSLKERHQLERPEPHGPGDGVQALSPHGRLLAAEDYANEALYVWDVLSGKQLRRYPLGLPATRVSGPSGPTGLHAVAFSPDEKLLAAVVRNGKATSLRVWDLKSWQETLNQEIAHSGWTDFMTFTPDARHVLISSDGFLSSHDLAGKQNWIARNIPAPTRYAFADGKILIQGDGLLAWDLATGQPSPLEKRPPESWDGAIAVTPDGKLLLLAGVKGVLVWDLVQGKAVRTLAGAGEEMVVAGDGRTLLTNSGALQRWDLESGKALYPDTFEEGHVGEVTAVVFSADGRRIVSGSADGSVRIWDPATSRPLRVWRGHEVRRPIRLTRWSKAGVTAVDISRDGSRVVSAGTEERVCVWDAVSGKQLHRLRLPEPVGGETDRFVPALRLRANGTQAAAVCGAQGHTGVIGGPPIDTRPRLATWDLKSAALLSSVPTSAGACVFSDDGDLLLTQEGLTDLVTGRQHAALPKTASLWAEPPFAFSRDASLIATGLAKRGIENGTEYIGPAGGGLWETRTGKLVVRFPTQSWLGSFAFHPDGRHVAINDLEGIQLVDAASGTVVHRYTMPERIRAGTNPGSLASCLAFSPDCTRLATGHPDGSILLWPVTLAKANAEPHAAADANALWADLANADAAIAWKAVWRLAESPEAAMAIIRARVKPVSAAPAATTDPLLADLSSESFERREAATNALRKIGMLAEPALRQHETADVPLEAKRRVSQLLKEITEASTSLTATAFQETRAVAVLARAGTPEARHILGVLAQGVPLAPLTRAARAALTR
jgi:RNA polymerase sigma factor (sigma-70 family)